MDFLNTLWATTLFPLLSSYGIALLVALILSLIGALFAAAIYMVPTIIQFLKSLAEKNLSEKVSKRINDALVKLEAVIIDILNNQKDTLNKMAKEAMANDGVIDKAEVKAMAKKLAEIAVTRITPDIETFKKYITGNALMDFVEEKIGAFVNQSVNNILEKQFGKK